MMRCIMIKPPRALASLALAALVAASITACGSSKTTPTTTSGASSTAATNTTPAPTPTSSSNELIATVGATPITRAQVNHWMTALAGTGYFTVAHQILPEGVVSDPPNYPACVAHIEAAAANYPVTATNENAVELLAKCREINEAVKLQATSFLVNAQVNLAAAHEIGLTPTSQATQQLFNKLKATEFPTTTALHEYLTRRHTTIPNIQFEAKLAALGNTIFNKNQTTQTLTRIKTAIQHWTTKTTCQTGYIVEHCNQYTTTPTPTTPTSAAVLFERLTHTTH
jgi:hypothetical protein